MKPDLPGNRPIPQFRALASNAGRHVFRGIVLVLLIIAVIPAAKPTRAQGHDDALIIDNSGNVGIGVQRPEGRLHVAGKLKANTLEGDGVVPKGAIVMWSGKTSDIPKGWLLCDGKDGATPDLRSRFIVGAGGSYGPGSNGEPDQLPPLAVKTEQAGGHSHKFPTKYYARQFLCGVAAAGKNWCTGIDTYGDYQKEQEVQAVDNHAHSLSVRFDASENRPRWYALCFIMKQ